MSASPAPIPTAVASRTTVHPTLTISGVIAPFQNVQLSSDLTEPVDAVYVNEGDRVHAGEVIAVLDTADLRAELASDVANTSHTYYGGVLSIQQGVYTVRQDRVTLHTDEINLERDEVLFREGYISRQTVDGQINTVNTDRQALASAISNMRANGTITGSWSPQLSDSGVANVSQSGSVNGTGLQASAIAQAEATAQQIRVSIQKATIYSPVDGTIVNRNLNPGEYPGSRTIFVIQEDDQVWAELNASSADVFKITKGSPVAMTVPGNAAVHYQGTVVGVLGQVSPGSTNFTVKVLIPHANGRLVAGLPVTGTIALTPTTGIGVPTTAFLDDSHSTLLYVGANNTAELAKVTEIASDGTTSIVTGVPAGTKVISNGQLGYTAGQSLSAVALPSNNASQHHGRF